MQATYCPWCDEPDYQCPHLVGWTEDGRTLQPYSEMLSGDDTELRPTDRIVMTGVSARVYRPVRDL